MTGRRLLVALVALPALYVVIQFLPPVGFSLFIVACIVVGLWEWYGLFSGRMLREAVLGAVVMVVGVLYIAGLLGHLILLRVLPGGPNLVLFVLAVTWLTDSAAYFGGRAWGKHALAPRVSPNKTIEGALSGFGGALVATWLGGWLWLPELTVSDIVSLALLLGGLGQIGDLVESKIKRVAGVKDSGRWIPGHGGLLDKIDSLVFTAPTFYYYLVWFKGYGRLLI
jgi:phosphatidate cytidylyltransferase